MEKNSFKDKKNFGFTLIETLVYASILVIFLGFSYLLLASFINVSTQTRSNIEVGDEANFILGKINWGLNQIQYVTVPATNTATTVALEIVDVNGQKNRFQISGNDMVISKNGAGTTTLNSSTTVISAFSAESRYYSDTISNSINVSFTVKKKQVGYSANPNLASTTVSTSYVIQQ